MISKVKCRMGYHDWFTETDKDQLPVYRLCQCCGKFQQPIICEYQFVWQVIPPGTVTHKVLKLNQSIVQLTKSSL